MTDKFFNGFETTMECNITNPSQLQEVTLDPDSTNFSYMGMRSPGAVTGGRSVKEIDEQLKNLKKENFDLKLRIYFLEERIGANFDTDKEDAIKTNIELRVELENLKKDSEAKQELLCEAAKAMEIEEEEKKKEIEIRDEQIIKLEEELFTIKKHLQDETNARNEDKELALCAQAFDLNIEGDRGSSLHLKIKKLQEELQQERRRSEELEHVMDIAEFTRTKCKELEEEVELKNNTLNVVSLELEGALNKLSKSSLRIHELENEISQNSSKVQIAVDELQQRESDINQQRTEVKELKKKCDNMLQEKLRWEKTAKKVYCESQILVKKMQDVQLSNENLRSKIQILESTSAGSSHQQVASKIETSAKQQKLTSNTLISAQNTDQENIVPLTLSKTLPKINTVHTLSPSPSSSPRKLERSNSPGQDAEKTSRMLESHSGSENSMDVPISSDLQVDPQRACKMIKSLILKKKECDKSIRDLQSLVSEKDKTIGYLQKQIAGLSSCDQVATRRKPIQEMVTEMKLTACFDPSTTKENSMEADETNLIETYKELIDELETKIEVLNETSKEKDLQLEILKISLQEKANQIIDLQFELLANNESVSNCLSITNEKEDTGTEKQDFDKDQQIERLENELRQRTSDLQCIVNNELWEKNRAIEKMQRVIKGKDAEIYTLVKDADVKEYQLKVLKDKVNELGAHVNLPTNLSTLVTTSDSLLLQDQLKACLDERINLIKEIDELRNKINNIPEHDENPRLKQVNAEYEDMRIELEKTEKLRQEGQEICLVLTARLEELCCFLNSLLKQKCVLGFLSSEQASKIREVVNRSLDLSQTLSTSLLLNSDQSLLQLNNITNLLNSTCNDNEVLTMVAPEDDNSVLSIIPTDVKLTYRSHLNISVNSSNEQHQVIQVLRQQVANLKREVELRDVELGKKLTNQDVPVNEINDSQVVVQPKSNSSYTLMKKNRDSDSESWSEPDRSVSLARIGLLDKSLRTPNTSITKCGRFATSVSTESTEDEHGIVVGKTSSKRTTLAESRHTVIALHEQVCELEEKLKEKENEVLTAQIATQETENLLKKEQIKRAEMKKEAADTIAEISKRLENSEKYHTQAEQKLETATQELISLTEQIAEKNKILEEAQKMQGIHKEKITELENLVIVLEDFKTNAVNLKLVNKEMQNTINELQIEKDKAIETAKATKVKLDKATKDVEVTQRELTNMQKREQQIREDLEINFEKSLKNAERQYFNSLQNIEQNYEAEITKCQEALVKMKQEYEKDYIKQSEVDKRLLEHTNITKEVESLKYFIKTCESKIHTMEEKEIEFKSKIQDMQREHHDKIYELHSELDSATLQYSEALLEKTKLQNETTCLEKKVQNFHAKESELIKEVNELHEEFKEVENKLQMQMTQLEHQKYLLEIKVSDLGNANSELQSVNAELRNRMIKLQMNRSIGERILSSSLPNCPGAIFDLYPNRTLPINIAFNSNHMLNDNSGYTSEDVIGDEARKPALLSGSKPFFAVEEERIHGNSSPDLGIESDQGRFSSMECNANVPKPLLPTLELSQCMNSLLDPIQDITCTNDQCCMKTKQMSDENVELRKRLLRTRRALEDTLHRLTMANKQKKEVEKSICKQIHQTSQVLRKAKANLDSGSESDVHKN